MLAVKTGRTGGQRAVFKLPEGAPGRGPVDERLWQPEEQSKFLTRPNLRITSNTRRSSFRISGMVKTRVSVIWSVSLPPQMARKAEALARRENRSRSELVREALRQYVALREGEQM